VMQAMVDTLQDQSLEAEIKRLEGFYESVRMRAEGIDNAEGKQRIVTELYERFFRIGFKKTSQSLGIVYTPIQIVDFILRAANDALAAEFGKSLSDDGVHVLDPFAGTGTFIVRLLQSGLIQSDDLLRKYTCELHANEIMLLAYYIAAINIEATFHGIHGGDYRPFNGIVLADTFQIAEDGDTMDAEMFPQNNDRILHQQNTPIRVIVGNPPYSMGQDSANDDNANVIYPTLDNRIRNTYLMGRGRGGSNSLFDSYIRAIRWATDRIRDYGIVAYVSNGGWIDGSTANGLRQALVDEFGSIYVYNLRGNQRGDWRKEGGKIFGEGSQTTVAILLAIKNPARIGPCEIRYRDIGDYLTREDKLAIVDRGTLATIKWESITPNPEGDWINQRNVFFQEFPPIGEKHDDVALTIFDSYSRGLESGRDAWVYNFSKERLRKNCQATLGFYMDIFVQYRSWVKKRGLARKKESLDLFFKENSKAINDSRKISWTLSLRNRLNSDRPARYSADKIVTGIYRPFCRQYVYFDRTLNHIVGRLPSMFPTLDHSNIGFYQVGAGSAVPFSVIMLDMLPNLHVTGAGSGGQFFPRWTYEKRDAGEGQLNFGDGTDAGDADYCRIDNITDAILIDYRAEFGNWVSKDDIFYYVYGILHSPQYRTGFAADLKKMLPRIPKAPTVDDFRAFTQAGRNLAELHVGYESAQPYPLEESVSGHLGSEDRDLYRVIKMRFKSKIDKSVLIYNGRVTLVGIPEEAHRYMLGSRSALEWLIDRYQVKTDKACGIVNDPNDWCDEHDNPRYIVDLVKRIVTVSVETMKVVDSLPSINW
jgi:predicted helicase